MVEAIQMHNTITSGSTGHAYLRGFFVIPLRSIFTKKTTPVSMRAEPGVMRLAN
jgi:hypothetical protein